MTKRKLWTQLTPMFKKARGNRWNRVWSEDMVGESTRHVKETESGVREAATLSSSLNSVNKGKGGLWEKEGIRRICGRDDVEKKRQSQDQFIHYLKVEWGWKQPN